MNEEPLLIKHFDRGVSQKEVESAQYSNQLIKENGKVFWKKALYTLKNYEAFTNNIMMLCKPLGKTLAIRSFLDMDRLVQTDVFVELLPIGGACQPMCLNLPLVFSDVERENSEAVNQIMLKDFQDILGNIQKEFNEFLENAQIESGVAIKPILAYQALVENKTEGLPKEIQNWHKHYSDLFHKYLSPQLIKGSEGEQQLRLKEIILRIKDLITSDKKEKRSEGAKIFCDFLIGFTTHCGNGFKERLNTLYHKIIHPNNFDGIIKK